MNLRSIKARAYYPSTKRDMWKEYDARMQKLVVDACYTNRCNRAEPFRLHFSIIDSLHQYPEPPLFLMASPMKYQNWNGNPSI